MIQIRYRYTCDYCNKVYEDNVILHIKANRQEMHEEGPIDLKGIEFDVCPECTQRHSLQEMFEYIGIERRKKNEKRYY